MQNRWTDIAFSLIRKNRINYLRDNLCKKACAFDVFFWAWCCLKNASACAQKDIDAKKGKHL